MFDAPPATTPTPVPADSVSARLDALARQRILVIDGAMGTMIQGYKLEEADYRGERFKDWAHDLKGNNDLLVLTQPQMRIRNVAQRTGGAIGRDQGSD